MAHEKVSGSLVVGSSSAYVLLPTEIVPPDEQEVVVVVGIFLTLDYREELSSLLEKLISDIPSDKLS